MPRWYCKRHGVYDITIGSADRGCPDCKPLPLKVLQGRWAQWRNIQNERRAAKARKARSAAA